MHWEQAKGIRFVRVEVGDVSLLCAEPQEFMNRSGPPVQALAAAFGIETAAILVVHDDLDLEFGRLKLKRDGGTAGHRGLESLLAALDTDAFPRLRLGIGRPPQGGAVIDFVLEPFAVAEGADLDTLIDESTAAIGTWLDAGTESAMNLVNVRRRCLELKPVDC